MRPLLTQERVAASAGAFLDGLLGAERRRAGWMQAIPGPGVSTRRLIADALRHV